MTSGSSTRGALRQAILLAAAGGGLGLAANGLNPEGLALGRPVLAGAGREGAACSAPIVQELSVEAAAQLLEGGAAFVDARPSSAFAEGQIAGAFHLPSRGEGPGFERILAHLQQHPVVIVYDADGGCAEARHLADRLVARGLPDVRVMLGGFPGWQRAGYECQSGACEVCDDPTAHEP